MYFRSVCNVFVVCGSQNDLDEDEAELYWKVMMVSLTASRPWLTCMSGFLLSNISRFILLSIERDKASIFAQMISISDCMKRFYVIK